MAQAELDDDDDEVEAPKPKSSSTKLIIIISIVALIAIGGSVAATLLLVGGSSSDEAVEEVAEEPSKKKSKKVKKKAIYIDMDPAFTVNFADQQAVRFLQIKVQLMSRDEAVAESIREHDPMIRNNLVLLFSSQSAVILGTREGKEQLRKDTLEEINKILKDETGNAGIESVFFTSLVMQ